VISIKRKHGNPTTGRFTLPAFRNPLNRARKMRTTLIAAAVIMFVGVGSAVLYANANAAPAGSLSGLPWESGASVAAETPAAAAAFGAWRGHPLDIATVWPDFTTWSDIVDPSWLYQRWQGSPITLAIGVPMLPEGVAGVSIQACANGSYNSYWQQFGTNISSFGLGKSIVRLGWEFNGNWYIWDASNPAVWVKCWQQIVTSARTTAPNLQWDWNVNRGVSSGLADPTQAYPGNAYVDTIGVDSYDQWPGATTSANWNQQLTGTQGLNYWLAFAIAHGKKFAVPEWGTVATGSGAGGDDPAYVNDMYQFFQANAGDIAYESTFQGASTGGVYGTGTLVPSASAVYKSEF
jgi:Glycosyl hydrolase family 26